MIIWNGIDSDSVGLYVEHYPGIVLPTRKQRFVSVPGRSGDIIIMDDSFENVTLSYDVFITETANMLVQQREITEWLFQPGYNILEDSYDVGTARRAAFVGGQELESVLNRAGRGTIEFNAWPQRYIAHNIYPREYNSSLTVSNPTNNEARPYILVKGSGSGVLNVGNQTISLSSLPVVLDSESQNAYYGTTNKNNTMTGDFPLLPAGFTSISWSGGVTGIEIAERWYYL